MLELGPGSGKLARDVLLELDALGALPNRYRLLEVSADLRERQRELLGGLKLYQLFFTTHDGQFDNIEGFLYKNDFDKVFSDDEYKFEDKHTNLGVVDDVMLRHAADLMDRETTPFFSVLLTSSHHTPFYTPPYFKREFSDDRTNAIHYADAALRIFIERAKKSPWYQNSISFL